MKACEQSELQVTSTFIMEKLKGVIWLVLNFNHFSKVSTSPFLPSIRGTLWLLWAGPGQ